MSSFWPPDLVVDLFEELADLVDRRLRSSISPILPPTPFAAQPRCISRI